MGNSSGQQKAKDTEPTESRKLNMEEKRKLEKLLISDIDFATSGYQGAKANQRQAIVEKLQRTPLPEVKKLYERYNLAVKQSQDAKHALTEAGFNVNYNGEFVVNSYGTQPKQLVEFDQRAEEVVQKLVALKRSYVIKLFADHADTQSLFGSLAKDLGRLIE